MELACVLRTGWHLFDKNTRTLGRMVGRDSLNVGLQFDILEKAGVQSRRIIIKGLLLYWLGISKSSKIRFDHVTNPENHKNEDFPIIRKVNI